MDAALLVSRLVTEGLAQELEPAEGCVASARLGDDPKLRLLRRLLESPETPQKVIVFSAFADTVRYLREELPEDLGGRRRAVVIGADTTPEERTAELGRFAPESVLGRDAPPPGSEEADLLFTNDVLSEGQNLQQAAAVISYDLPWNPQRVVQRYGRVIWLKSEHETVFLTTMLPAPGDLEPLLRLEAAIRRKLRAADLYGLEVEIVEGAGADPGAEVLRFADRLARGDRTLLDEPEGSGLDDAFSGEALRRRFQQALAEGALRKLRNLPWGVGAAFTCLRPASSAGPGAGRHRRRGPGRRGSSSPAARGRTTGTGDSSPPRRARRRRPNRSPSRTRSTSAAWTRGTPPASRSPAWTWSRPGRRRPGPSSPSTTAWRKRAAPGTRSGRARSGR